MEADLAPIWREAIREFNARNVERFAAHFDEDAEWWPLRASTEGPYRGPDGIRAWFSDTEQVFDYMRADVEDFEQRGDVVLASGRLELRGAGSGATVDVPVTWVVRVKGEKVIWGRSYTDRDAALAELERI